MTYELAKSLKDAGFPQKCDHDAMMETMAKIESVVHYPTLEELIEACGDDFFDLQRLCDPESKKTICWGALHHPSATGYEGKTPREAVARLYLKIHKK